MKAQTVHTKTNTAIQEIQYSYYCRHCYFDDNTNGTINNYDMSC